MQKIDEMLSALSDAQQDDLILLNDAVQFMPISDRQREAVKCYAHDLRAIIHSRNVLMLAIAEEGLHDSD